MNPNVLSRSFFFTRDVFSSLESAEVTDQKRAFFPPFRNLKEIKLTDVLMPTCLSRPSSQPGSSPSAGEWPSILTTVKLAPVVAFSVLICNNMSIYHILFIFLSLG